VRIGIGEGTETVIIFLAGRIPQSQLNVLAINLDVGDIVLENRGDIDLERTSAYGAWGCQLCVLILDSQVATSAATV
jgi:hypothetical protein